MKITKWHFAIIFAILVFLMSGCSETEEEVLKEAQDIASAKFEEESLESNQDVEHFSLFLPEGFTIVEETMNNLLLEKEDKTYILFYNPLEEKTSRLNYEAANAMGNFTLLESFETDDRFGYISVTTSGDEEASYELQIGVGGAKITTMTTLDDLVEDTETLMQMANSIAYTQQ
ncbi:hypothetical protein NC661_02810 [Aquibacillus koreensis]|uniref:Uncharacterized protein n=1 Tax=Aquibacillus koreensis TaxID=279446 RepID=A0A9X3WIT7_9BACI|nr:hypothetical protein [Aquibacillus koreensis]MCT2535023.1 hypothetical protein [Aquibacillus koreensis]MDC3419310.1 hypothetical protein [Aquibacillus koreensis]